MGCLLPVCTSSAGRMREMPGLETCSAQPADALWQEAHLLMQNKNLFALLTICMELAPSSHLCVEMGMLHLLNSSLPLEKLKSSHCSDITFLFPGRAAVIWACMTLW